MVVRGRPGTGKARASRPASGLDADFLGGLARALDRALGQGLDTGQDRQVFRTLLRRLALHANAGEPAGTACDAAADVARMSGPAVGPGDSTWPLDSPKTLMPAPETLTLEMVTFAAPEFTIVICCVPLPPTLIAPKLTEEALSESAPCTGFRCAAETPFPLMPTTTE